MGMITCDNCGAQYDEEADKCPYCGSDNFGKVVQEHEDIINGLNREKEHLEQLPQKAAKKGKSLVTKLLIGLIVLVIVVAGKFLFMQYSVIVRKWRRCIRRGTMQESFVIWRRRT